MFRKPIEAIAFGKHRVDYMGQIIFSTVYFDCEKDVGLFIMVKGERKNVNAIKPFRKGGRIAPRLRRVTTDCVPPAGIRGCRGPRPRPPRGWRGTRR